MELWNALGLDPARHTLVALVGGGGKTTALYALAQEAVSAGRRVLITATTHMRPHPRLPLAGAPADLPALFAQHPAVQLGVFDQPGKLTCPVPPEALPGLADVVLAEADGAHGLPLKAPANHEPVVPANAQAVVAVLGLDALGEPIQAVCHRPEQVSALLGTSPGHRVTPADAALLLSSPAGGRKSVPPGARFCCLLNKADTPERRRGAQLIQQLLADRGVPAVIHSFSTEERDGLCWF